MSRIDALTVKNPCSASWTEMKGTGGSRFCTLCSKVVTDTTSVTACELEKMLDAPVAPCLRVHRDRSGRILTLDRLAAAAFVGLAACTGAGPETGAETGDSATVSWYEPSARPMGTGGSTEENAGGGGGIAELIHRVRTETNSYFNTPPDSQGQQYLPTVKMGDIAEPPPVMMGGIAPPPQMGEPAPDEPVPEMGKPAPRFDAPEIGR